MSNPVVVIGAGAFGTALACVIARNGPHVILFGRDIAKCNWCKLHVAMIQHCLK